MTTVTAEPKKPSYLELQHAQRDLGHALRAEQRRHEDEMQRIQREQAAVDERLALFNSELNLPLIDAAEAVMVVGGEFTRAGADRHKAVATAIDMLLNGGDKLREEYVGTKDYAHWHGQEIGCEYGYAPRHGSVIFRIELTRAVRAEKRSLTPAEIEACVYYLRNLERIQTVKKAGGALAPA